MAKAPTLAKAIASLRAKGLAEHLRVPWGTRQRFYRHVRVAMELYRSVSTPKGHPDSPAATAMRYRAVGQAAVSGSPQRVSRQLGRLTEGQRSFLKDLAGASSGWSQPPTEMETATAALLGSSASPQRSAKRRAKQGPSPPRTLGGLPGGKPSRDDLTVLVSFLAVALAGATGRIATRGSKNLGASGKVIPSALELLVSEVQAALGEVGQWDAIDRVRRHIAARDGKPPRRR